MNRSKYYPALTGLRALAVYMIFFNHYTETPLSLELHTGITVFFVLSGFLITLRYYDLVRTDLSWYKNFLFKRFSRIYPLYLIVTIITLILLHDQNFKDWVLSLTLTKALFNQYKFIGVSQAWFLTVEAIFYLLAPLMFILDRKKISFIFQFLITLAIGIIISSKGHFINPGDFISSHLFLFRYTFIGHFSDFLAGILLARILMTREVKPLQTHLATYGGIFLSLGLILELVHLQSNIYRLGALNPFGVIVNNLFLPISLAVLFYGLITEQTLISQLLSTKLFIILGQSAYIFFLIHLDPISQLLPDIFKLNLLTLFIGVNIFSVIIYYLVEKPITSYLDKFL